MVEQTIEGFIKKLRVEGYTSYASELRKIVAMSRERKDAEAALTGITITLLIHLLKYMALPQARERSKWYREIKGYLLKFDIRNESPKKRPWLPIKFIYEDLNDVLFGSKFLPALEQELEEYSVQERKKVKTFVESHKTLKDMGIELFYGPTNDLKININGRVLFN